MSLLRHANCALTIHYGATARFWPIVTHPSARANSRRHLHGQVQHCTHGPYPQIPAILGRGTLQPRIELMRSEQGLVAKAIGALRDGSYYLSPEIVSLTTGSTRPPPEHSQLGLIANPFSTSGSFQQRARIVDVRAVRKSGIGSLHGLPT